ncbi:MAG: prolyl oligopeptidase family protein [Limisphaerales bacterium]|nr:MAG: prolyl oligopeptidase family protein [Limisphaerales bacterium]TXT50064.1 MAG: prolyl oligopeptidase family protein [Limisphaerales bacterium]
MHRLLAAVALALTALALSAAEVPWPKLPERDGPIVIPAQEWPLRPGPREVRVLVHYPGGTRASIGPRTGIFLTLHNWGGTDCAGTANPAALAREFNCVALCVNYLQSGPKDSIEGPEPYDFGWLQGLDALRALWLVFNELDTTKTPFARGRLFATGGSGGGNVTLMANKLAPRTFTAVVDMCGMKKLSDALAYNLPAAGGLNARWSRDSASPNFLSPGAQEIRFVGHPAHLAEMKRLGTTAKVFSVHGLDDKTCLADGQEMVANMTRAGLDITPVWVTKEMVDGKIFSTTGHALGNRTLIPGHVAGKFLRADSPDALDRKTPTDFERREDIRYVTTDGVYVISYAQGFPVGRFEPALPSPGYPDRFDVLRVASASGIARNAQTPAEWEPRCRHIAAALERVMGPFPNPAKRAALDVKVLEEVKLEGGLLRRKLTYQSDATDRVAAYLFLPESSAKAKLPTVLCLHQTTKLGKAESAGLVDNPKQYALHLAQRGYVTFAPDYPSFGDSKYDFDPRHGYASGTMKAIWDNVRAVDLLESLPEVDAARLGVIGHSLGGHNAMFTAVFEPRLRVIVSSCGFTTFRKDDMPSWTGKVYMPRIKTEFANAAARVPFDFPEIVAAFAPRPFLTCSAEGDTDFDVSGVRDVLAAARKVYELHGQAGNLVGYYPKGPHAFPDDARKVAYEFLDRHLRGEK